LEQSSSRRFCLEKKMTYDSAPDTQLHIKTVRGFIDQFIYRLGERGSRHDASKLESPEKELFDEYTPKLRDMTYGSDEYKACLGQMGVALKHHYAVNSHHPEFHENGVSGMDLLDVFEMLADWRAATSRHADGDIVKSLEINRKRFGLSDQLFEILMNTIDRMGWK